MVPPMKVIPDSSHSVIQEGYSKQQQSSMIIKYRNKSLFMLFNEKMKNVNRDSL